MKSSLIIGMVSAHVPFMALEETEAVEPQTVTALQCQYTAGTYFFDLMPFDSIGSKENPTDVQFGDYDFQYKVCQSSWGVEDTEPEMVAGTCKDSSIAFIG
jgi:hypothetical protein